MSNTLYVVGVPAGEPGSTSSGIADDLTLRARRILSEVCCVAASDVAWARRWLARLDCRPRLVAAADQDLVWEALDGGDVALLSGGDAPGLPPAGLVLIRAALDRDIPVVPIPGPVLPVSALVVSGFPADRFVFLGWLPEEEPARRHLLKSVALDPRTLLVVEEPERLGATLADLYAALGERPLVVLASSGAQPAPIWRGMLSAAGTGNPPDLHPGRCALVLGGARLEAPDWDEARLRAEIAARLEQGLRTKEISQELVSRSGWSRREIYRLAVEQAQSLANDRKET